MEGQWRLHLQRQAVRLLGYPGIARMGPLKRSGADALFPRVCDVAVGGGYKVLMFLLRLFPDRLTEWVLAKIYLPAG